MSMFDIKQLQINQWPRAKVAGYNTVSIPSSKTIELREHMREVLSTPEHWHCVGPGMYSRNDNRGKVWTSNLLWFSQVTDKSVEPVAKASCHGDVGSAANFSAALRCVDERLSIVTKHKKPKNNARVTSGPLTETDGYSLSDNLPAKVWLAKTDTVSLDKLKEDERRAERKRTEELANLETLVRSCFIASDEHNDVTNHEPFTMNSKPVYMHLDTMRSGMVDVPTVKRRNYGVVLETSFPQHFIYWDGKSWLVTDNHLMCHQFKNSADAMRKCIEVVAEWNKRMAKSLDAAAYGAVEKVYNGRSSTLVGKIRRGESTD